MPPRDPHRGFEPHDFLTRSLEEVLRIDPKIDVRPGSPVRTLIEAATQAAENSVQPAFGTNLPALIDRARGRDRTGLVIQTLRRINEEQLRGRTTFAVMLDDAASFNAPLTRADFERAREEIERMDARARTVRQPPFLLDPQTRQDIVGGDWRERARQEIMAAEDAEIFRQLDAIASTGNWAERDPRHPEHDPRMFQQEYMATFPEPVPAEHAPDWHLEELPGRAVVNPRAVERAVPYFPIQTNPTVRIDEIRNRRFNMRQEPAMTNPCGEISLGAGEMSLDEMRRVALIVRRTVWERLLDIEELEYPDTDPQPVVRGRGALAIG